MSEIGLVGGAHWLSIENEYSVAIPRRYGILVESTHDLVKADVSSVIVHDTPQNWRF